MKISIGVIATIIVGGIFQIFFPFWTLAVAAFIVAMFVGGKGPKAFLYGLLGGILLWGFYALFIDIANEGILSNRFGNLLGGLGRPIVLLLTALIGGLLGGFGALTGSFVHQFFNNNKVAEIPPMDEEIEYNDFKNLRKEWDDQDFA